MGDEDEFGDVLEVFGDQVVELEFLGEFGEKVGGVGCPLLAVISAWGDPLVKDPIVELVYALIWEGIEIDLHTLCS